MVLGNIYEADDYCHRAGPEENFNESVYYNFFDRASAVGGFVRCGNRVNEGQAEMTVCLYQPDGSVCFVYKRAKITSNNGWCAGGLTVHTRKGLVKNETVYVGRAIVLRNPMAMLNPRQVYKMLGKEGGEKQVPVTVAVEHVACGPVWGYSAENYWASLPEEERKRYNK